MDLTRITLSACVLGQLLWILYGYGAKDKIILTVAVVTVSVYLVLLWLQRPCGEEKERLEGYMLVTNEPHTRPHSYLRYIQRRASRPIRCTSL